MPGFGDDDYDDKFPASREGGTFWFRVASGAEFPFSLYPPPPHHRFSFPQVDRTTIVGGSLDLESFLVVTKY